MPQWMKPWTRLERLLVSTETLNIQLPRLEDDVTHREFVRHTLALAARLSETIDTYVGEQAEADPDNAPEAYAVGAACYAAAHITASSMPDDDQRAAEIKGGLFAALLANDDTLRTAFPPNLNN